MPFTPEQKKQYRKTRYDELGMCVRCSIKEANKPYKTCDDCRLYTKQRRIESISKNACITCETPLDNPAVRYCYHCTQKGTFRSMLSRIFRSHRHG